jgi:hypothetical protein
MSMEPDPSVSIMRQLIENHRSDLGALRRLYTVSFSPSRSARFTQLFDDAEEQLSSGVDFEALDSPGRIDWHLFRHYLDFERATLLRAEEKAAAIANLIPFAPALIKLEEDRVQMRPQEPRASATVVADVAEQVAATQAYLTQRLKTEGKFDMKFRISGRRASMAVNELRQALSSWNSYYSEWHPEFGWWLKAPYASTDAALAEYGSFLRKEVAAEVETGPGGRGGAAASADQILGDPIGREALLEHLQNDMIPYTPDELVAMAEKEWAWCEREMVAAASALGFEGKTLKMP